MSRPRSLRERLHHLVSRLLFEWTARFYGWMTWQRTWREHCASLVEHFGVPSGPEAGQGAGLRILDLGIGPGISGIGILDRLPLALVVGLDFAAAMLRLCRHYLAKTPYRLPLVQADATQLPFADGSFDVITHHSFLYLLPQKAEALDEMHRVLRPGGRYVILEPHLGGRMSSLLELRGELRFRFSMFAWSIFSRGYGRFSKQALTDLLTAHGFVDVRIEETLNGLGLLAVAQRGPA